MTTWIEPIYDRTESDVDRVKYLENQIRNSAATASELQEWKSDLKGALNKSDLQRIVNNCKVLSELLGVTIVNQTVPEIPTIQWYAQLLNNVSTLKNRYIVHSDTPGLPTEPLNTYEKWNIVEKILWDMNDIFKNSPIYYATGSGEIDLFCNDYLI